MLERTLSLFTKIRQALSPKILMSGTSPISGSIKVIEADGQRRLTVDGYTQSRSLLQDHLTHGYWDEFVKKSSLRPEFEIERVLVLGLGAGTVVKLLNYWVKPKEIVAVELDPQIVALAKKYFSLTDPNLKIIVGEALEEVKKLVKGKVKFDLIAVDLYLGGEDVADDDSFYLSLKKLLNKEGKIVTNKIFFDAQIEQFSSRMKKIFSQVQAQKLPHNFTSNNTIVVLKP